MDTTRCDFNPGTSRHSSLHKHLNPRIAPSGAAVIYQVYDDSVADTTSNMWSKATGMPTLYSSAGRKKEKEREKDRERESRDSRSHSHAHTSKSESRSRRRHHKSDDERYSPPPTSPTIYTQHNVTLDKVVKGPSKNDIPPATREPLPSATKARPKSIAFPLSEAPKVLQKYQPTVEDYQSDTDLARFGPSPRSSTRSIVSTSDREKQYPDFRQKTPDADKKSDSSKTARAHSQSRSEKAPILEEIPPVPKAPSVTLAQTQRSSASEAKAAPTVTEQKAKTAATETSKPGVPLSRTSSRAAEPAKQKSSEAPSAAKYTRTIEPVVTTRPTEPVKQKTSEALPTSKYSRTIEPIASKHQDVGAPLSRTTSKNAENGPSKAHETQPLSRTSSRAAEPAPTAQKEQKPLTSQALPSAAPSTAPSSSSAPVPQMIQIRPQAAERTIPTEVVPAQPMPMRAMPMSGYDRLPGSFPIDDDLSRTPTQAVPEPAPIRSQPESSVPSSASSAASVVSRSSSSATEPEISPKASIAVPIEQPRPRPTTAQNVPGSVQRPSSTGPISQAPPPRETGPAPISSPVHRPRSSTIQAAPSHRLSQYIPSLPPLPQQVAHQRHEFPSPRSSPPTSHPTSPTLQPLPAQAYVYHPSPPPAYVPMAMSSNVMSHATPEHLSLTHPQSQPPPPQPNFAMVRQQAGYEQPPSPYMHHMMLARQAPYPASTYTDPYYAPPAQVAPPPTAPVAPPPAPTSEAGTEHSHGDSIVPRLGLDDDPTDLLHRVTAVLPDLNRLLQNYRSAQGELSTRDVVSRQQYVELEQSLMRKDFYVTALEGQMRKAADERAEESAALKREITEMATQIVSLKDGHAELETKHKDVTEAHTSSQTTLEELRAEQAKTNTDMEALRKELDEAKTAAAKLAEEKQAILQANDNMAQGLQKEREDRQLEKRDMQTRFEAALKSQQTELQKTFDEEKIKQEAQLRKTFQDENAKLKADLQRSFDEQRSQLLKDQQARLAMRETEFAREKDVLRTQMEDDKKRLEAVRVAAEAEMLARISSLKLDLEEARQDYQDELEDAQDRAADELKEVRRKHTDEIAAVKRACDQELKGVDVNTEKRISNLISEHARKEASWRKERDFLEEQIAQKSAQGQRHLEERSELQKARVAKEEQLKNAKEEFARMYSNMEKDRQRLDRIMQSLGEANMLKGKGDQF